MAVYVSPGVYFRVIDLSLYAPRLSTCILANVGTATKGPMNTNRYVSTHTQAIREFGNPDPDHLATIAEQQFLSKGNQSYFVRVSDGTETNASAGLQVGEGVARIENSALGPFALTEALPGVIEGLEAEPYVIVASTVFSTSGSNSSGNLGAFQALTGVTLGQFALSYTDRDSNTTVYQVAGLDFGAAGSMADVASIIQGAMRTLTGNLVTFTYVTDHFESEPDLWDSGVNASVSYIAGSGGDTDINGAGYMVMSPSTITVGVDGNDIMELSSTDYGPDTLQSVRLTPGTRTASNIAVQINGNTDGINAEVYAGISGNVVHLNSTTLGAGRHVEAHAVDSTVEAYTTVLGPAVTIPADEEGSDGGVSLDLWVDPWGYYKSGDSSANLANFQGVSMGRITVDVDGVGAIETADCDFTGATTMVEVATILETRINAVLPGVTDVFILWSDPYFYIVSQDPALIGATSSVVVSDATTGGKVNLNAAALFNPTASASVVGNAIQEFLMTPGAAVTVDQLVLDLATLNGAVASNYRGYLRIDTTGVGPQRYILVDSTSTIDTVIGLDNSAHWGTSAGAVSSLLWAPTPGTAGNNLTGEVLQSYYQILHQQWVTDHVGDPVTESDYYAWRDAFRIDVYDSGYKVASYDNLVIDDVDHEDYIETRLGTLASSYRSDRIVAAEDMMLGLAPAVGETFTFTGGTNGVSGVIDYIGQVLPDGTKTGLLVLDNPETLDINLVIVPGVSDENTLTAMIQLCEGRGDCMCIIDTPFGLDGAQDAVNWSNRQGTWSPGQPINTWYAAIYWPWIEIYDNYSKQDVWTPPSGHAAAVYAYTDYISDPWFAPAGFNRAHIIAGKRLETEYISQGDRDLLYGYPNVVNPIVNFFPDGITIWGQKTCLRRPSALDRVNVARLILYARKIVATVIKYLVFEPNDAITWRRYELLCNPIFEQIQRRRGLYEFRVVCDATTNLPDLIDQNLMKAIIYLKPTKAAEMIETDFVITTTGASFDEIEY